MPALQIRISYDEMGQIAKTFSKNAEDIAQVTQKIRAAQDTLEGGDWIGQGAKKFQGEMESSINPSMKGLQDAMEEASQVSSNINKVMHEADEESANILVLIFG